MPLLRRPTFSLPTFSLTATSLTATALTAVLLIAGCSSPDTDEAAVTTEGGCATESTSGSARPIPITPAAVTLVESGAEPRAVAGESPNRAAAQQVTLTTNSTQASVGESSGEHLQIPIEARFGCEDSTNIEMTLGEVTAPDDVVLDEALDPVAGSAAGISVGPGLVPASLRLIPAEDADSQARSAVEQSLIQAFLKSVPLPTEPIGVGARWTVERTLTAATILDQRIEATLEEWDGNRVRISYTAEESPQNSIFTIPGSNETLTITRYSYTGTGEVTYDLTRGLPVAGSAEYSGARELVGGGDPLQQQLGFTVSWQ